MRRLTTTLLLTLAVFLAGIAFTAFWWQQTVFSPDRGETAARHVLQAPVVTHLVIDQVTAATLAGMPQPIEDRVGAGRVRDAVATAVHDPQVTDALVRAFARTHRYVVDGPSPEPIVVDAAPVTRAVAAALSPVSREAAVAVAAHPLQVRIPTAALPDLSWLHRLVDALVIWSTLLAVGCAAGALLLAINRPQVLSRLGAWLIGLTAVQLVLVWAAPTWVLPRLGAWGTLLAQVSTDLNSGVFGALAVMFCAGLTALVGGRIWARVQPTPSPVTVAHLARRVPEHRTR
jgi:hypothetical protein